MDWGAFLSAFGLVFVAELGDKTQLAIVTQTCKYRCAWPVFLGGSLALTAVTGLGAATGQLLGRVAPPGAMRLVAAIAFVVMGAFIWREARKIETREAACDPDLSCEPPRRSLWNWRAFGVTLSLLFVAELGDKTQLAVLGMTMQQATPWLVFVGGSLALTCVTALGVLGGQQLCRWIPERLLLRLSAGAFVSMGVLMGLGVL